MCLIFEVVGREEGRDGGEGVWIWKGGAIDEVR